MFIGKLDLEGLKLESAITHCIKDLREINQIENIILNTESPDIVSHYYNMLHNENVVFDTQSALVGKEGLLDKIKHLKERIVKSFEESNTAIKGYYKKSYNGRVKSLKELKEKIIKGEMIEKTTANNQNLNQYFGLFNMIGYNLNNISDIIKAFTFHQNAGMSILKENMDYGKEMYKFILKADEIVDMVKSGHLKPSNTSLMFLKSIKDVEFKKIEFYTGFPTMVFTKKPGILTLSTNDKEKIVVDTDIISTKEIKFNTFKKEDIVKLIDVAINVLENSAGFSSKITDIVKPVLPTMITTYGNGATTVETTDMRLVHANVGPNITNAGKFLDNLLTYAKHLSFTPYYVVKICEQIVENNLEKKKKITTESAINTNDFNNFIGKIRTATNIGIDRFLKEYNFEKISKDDIKKIIEPIMTSKINKGELIKDDETYFDVIRFNYGKLKNLDEKTIDELRAYINHSSIINELVDIAEENNENISFFISYKVKYDTKLNCLYYEASISN